MEPTIIATIAGTAVSMLVPFLQKLGGDLAKKAVDGVGAKAGDAVWAKAKQLYEMVKSKFAQKPESNRALTALEKNPDDPDTQAVIRYHLKEILSSDEKFAKELAGLLKEVSDSSGGDVYNNTNYGNVEKLNQIGSIKGDVKF